MKAFPAFGRRRLHTNTDYIVDRPGLNKGWPTWAWLSRKWDLVQVGHTPVEGVWRRRSREKGVQWRGSQEERTNLGRTHENFEHTPTHHNTPHHNTTQHNNNDTPNITTGDPAGLGQGGSFTGRSMAQKTRHDSPRFFGVKDCSQRFGHKTV